MLLILLEVFAVVVDGCGSGVEGVLVPIIQAFVHDDNINLFSCYYQTRRMDIGSA